MGTFEEIFKKSFLGQYENSQLSWEGVIIALLTSFVLSLFVLFIYKKSYQSTAYNKSFGASLPLASTISTMILLAVSSNIILSFGMVGALSIIRFRTALKNPLDSIFMYWAIGIGITTGAGMVGLAFVGTIFTAIILAVVHNLELFDEPYILIVSSINIDEEKEIYEIVADEYKKFELRNKTVTKERTELTFEIRSKTKMISVTNKLNALDGVSRVIILTAKGDFITE